MNAIEALNRSVGLTLAGVRLNFKRVSSLIMLEVAERFIVDSRLTRIKQVAELLTDTDRLGYVTTETAKIPDGAALEKEARDLIEKRMPDEVACRLIQKGVKEGSPDLTLDDISKLAQDASKEELVAAIEAVLGKSTSPAGKTSGPQRKSATGRQKR